MARTRSDVTYRGQGMLVDLAIEGLDSVSQALEELKSKSPAAAKVAINATAREARKLMIAQAKARYAVNAAGQRHLKDLVQGRRATNTNLSTELRISSMRNDLGYFKTSPPVPTHFTGTDWQKGPRIWQGKVLKNGSMKTLPGEGNKAKAFLAEFSNGHVGMVQRVTNSDSSHKETASGKPRWKNRLGKVEKLVTLGSPSAAAMHRTVWWDVEDDVQQYMLDRLQIQIQKIIERNRK